MHESSHYADSATPDQAGERRRSGRRRVRVAGVSTTPTPRGEHAPFRWSHGPALAEMEGDAS